MPRGRIFVLSVLCFTFFVSHAEAQKRHETKPPSRVEPGKVASAEEPDFTRFRVVTDEGILAVFDADEEWDGCDEPASQLAYWHDFGSHQLFFFDQLLFTPADVLQSVATMQRDLNIDPAPILTEKPEFDPLPDITSPGQWRTANELDVLIVMAGGVPSSGEQGNVSGLIDRCVPGTCPDPRALATSEPLAAPLRGTPRSQLFLMAQAGSNCDCGGGGGCSCPSDGFRCSVDACVNGECQHVWPDCPEPDACTTGSCDETTGNCDPSSFCGSGTCCSGENNWCVPAEATDCCEGKWPNPWCEGNKPHCCSNNFTCCASEADCCHNDCKEACDVNCCEDGWHDGPCCGTTGCRSWQVCCNGQCCGTSPCVRGECLINLCVSVAVCDDGNQCTNDYCDIEDCGAYTCPDPTPNSHQCEDDGNVCTYDYCVESECIHPNKPDDFSCASDGNDCTRDVCRGGVCSHLPWPDGTSCQSDSNGCTDDHCVGGSCAHPARPDETACSDGDSCTGPDLCYGGICIGEMCPGPCCSGNCCDVGEDCCGNSCCLPENCCDETCCSALDAGQAAAITCCSNPCDPSPCNDDNVCTKDTCSVVNGEAQCKHKKRIDLTVQGNTPSLANLTEQLEDQSPGKIMCVGAVGSAPGVAPPQISISLDLSGVPSSILNGSVVRLEVSANVIQIYDTAAFINPDADPAPQPLSLPYTWINLAHPFKRTLYLNPIAPGTATITATWVTNAGSCSDDVAITVRDLWTNEDFPQIAFDVSGADPNVDAAAPRPINIPGRVGFGAIPPKAITWTPQVKVESSGQHVSCNEFKVGIVQNMITFDATFTYGDGLQVAHLLTRMLDQMKVTPTTAPGRVPFYSTTTEKTITACGGNGTGPMSYEDTPEASSTINNTCEGKNQPIQSISFDNSLETWLVAKHSPSGCYTVLKHFTWSQHALTPNTHSTTKSEVDNSPGIDVTNIKITPPIFNNTIGAANCRDLP